MTDLEMEAFAANAERDLRGEIPATALRWVLPANSDPVVPQDPQRRVRFAEHLAEITEGAVLDQAQLRSDPLDPEPVDALSGNVCGACRGSCCRSGGDQAYITEETIVRSLEAHPDWSVAQIAEAYLKWIPRESVADSCIYHSAQGCGLPRALRSSTCNRYLCARLRNLQASRPSTPVLAVLFDAGTWTRTALIDPEGVTVLRE